MFRILFVLHWQKIHLSNNVSFFKKRACSLWFMTRKTIHNDHPSYMKHFFLFSSKRIVNLYYRTCLATNENHNHNLQCFISPRNLFSNITRQQTETFIFNGIDHGTICYKQNICYVFYSIKTEFRNIMYFLYIHI